MIRSFMAACISLLTGVKRPADDTVRPDESEMAPAKESKELRAYAEDFVFLLSIVCIALMLLLGLVIPAIMAVGLCLLIVERRTRYRAAFAGKAAPV
jgi:hypothetical protein